MYRMYLVTPRYWDVRWPNVSIDFRGTTCSLGRPDNFPSPLFFTLRMPAAETEDASAATKGAIFPRPFIWS